jgi:c-di-GMP-binding flagellar brake protein YcgR
MTEAQRPSRHYPRYEFAGHVTVIVPRQDKLLSLWGLIANLSEGGMAATVAGELTRNDIVTLQFSVGTGIPEFEIRSLVRHQRGYHCGFEFITLTNPQRELIKKACEETGQ